MSQNGEPIDAMQVTISGALLKLLVAFNQRWDKEHSLNYTFEEALLLGIEQKRRSKEYSAAQENRKKFEKEIAADPSVIMDPKRMAALCRKFGIGASNASMSNTLDEIETAPAPATETVVKPTVEAATGTKVA